MEVEKKGAVAPLSERLGRRLEKSKKHMMLEGIATTEVGAERA
jgi:hypothetical protein